MTPKRFETLAEAFGGDVARWPAAEREAAAALMSGHPDWARGVLARAGELDAALASHSELRATGELADRIAATAPSARPRWAAWVLPAGMGAGLAAACAAGVMMGAQLTAAPTAVDDALVTAVAYEDFDLYLDEEAG